MLVPELIVDLFLVKDSWYMSNYVIFWWTRYSTIMGIPYKRTICKSLCTLYTSKYFTSHTSRNTSVKPCTIRVISTTTTVYSYGIKLNKNCTVWFKYDEIQTAAQQSLQDSLRLVGLSLTSRVIVEISSAASRGALVRRLLDRQTIITNAPTFDRYELIANFCDVCVKLSPVRSFWKYSAFSYPVAQTPAEAHRLKPTEYLLIFYCWVYLNLSTLFGFCLFDIFVDQCCALDAL